MIFDGSEIKVGDSVYDMAYGSGRVAEINLRGNSFRVSFGARSFSFTPDGTSTFPRKTLYWREPLGGFIPPKDDAKWDMFMTIRTAVAQALGL